MSRPAAIATTQKKIAAPAMPRTSQSGEGVPDSLFANSRDKTNKSIDPVASDASLIWNAGCAVKRLAAPAYKITPEIKLIAKPIQPNLKNKRNQPTDVRVPESTTRIRYANATPATSA